MALLSLRISSPLNRAWLVAMGILSIVLLHTGVIATIILYIQSIGSGMVSLVSYSIIFSWCQTVP